MTFGWEHVASSLGGITMLLLSYLIRRQGKIEENLQADIKDLGQKVDNHKRDILNKLEKKVDVADCDTIRGQCRIYCTDAVQAPICRKIDNIKDLQQKDRDSQERVTEDIWSAINTHTHESLPKDAGVIRQDVVAKKR